jgi:hypothetical protein
MRPWVLSAEHRGHAYFRELRKGEVRRIPIPRTSVNKCKKKGRRLEMSRPLFLPIVLQRSRRNLFITYCLPRALCFQIADLRRRLAVSVERQVDRTMH